MAKARALYNNLTVKIRKIRDDITSDIPPTITQAGQTIVKPYNIDGSLSKRAESALDMHVRYPNPSGTMTSPYIHIEPSAVGPFSAIAYKEFNLDSHPQVKDYLLSLGWKPTEWNFGKDPNTGQSKLTSPKLTEDSYKSLPPGIGQKIADYYVMQHRRRFILNKKNPKLERGAISTVRSDGRIPAKAMTCATPTSRYRHMETICNVPRISTAYGPEIRGLFGATPGHLQIGIDLSGIEARGMCHYALPYPGGQELADLVLHGDYHDFNASNWDVIRDLAKNGLYALIYGCGEAKLASTLGKPKKLGKALFDNFWDNNPALKALILDIGVAFDQGRQIRAIDRRVLSIRQKRMGLNTLIQGTSAIIFKHWMRLCDNYIQDYNRKSGTNIHQIIAYHDELQFEIATNDLALAMDQAAILADLAGEAGRILKVKVPIAAEYKVGKNWADCH
jgi:hypothetical protein